MRISDWSSDVCSSDLPHQQSAQFGTCIERNAAAINAHHVAHDRQAQPGSRLAGIEPCPAADTLAALGLRNAFAVVFKARKSCVEGKSVSVRVVLVCRHRIKKKIKQKNKNH